MFDAVGLCMLPVGDDVSVDPVVVPDAVVDEPGVVEVGLCGLEVDGCVTVVLVLLEVVVSGVLLWQPHVRKL